MRVLAHVPSKAIFKQCPPWKSSSHPNSWKSVLQSLHQLSSVSLTKHTPCWNDCNIWTLLNHNQSLWIQIWSASAEAVLFFRVFWTCFFEGASPFVPFFRQINLQREKKIHRLEWEYHRAPGWSQCQLMTWHFSPYQVTLTPGTGSFTQSSPIVWLLQSYRLCSTSLRMHAFFHIEDWVSVINSRYGSYFL